MRTPGGLATHGRTVWTTSRVNTLQLYAHDKEAPLAFGSGNHKLEFDIARHEVQDDDTRLKLDAAALAAHPTRAQYLSSD